MHTELCTSVAWCRSNHLLYAPPPRRDVSTDVVPLPLPLHRTWTPPIPPMQHKLLLALDGATRTWEASQQGHEAWLGPGARAKGRY